MANDPIKVLYIAGSGRSGTTIMARLLGEMEGFVNVGEAARFLFDANLRARGAPCGCGHDVSKCEFWKDIAAAIPAGLADQGARLVRMRHFPSLLMRNKHSEVPADYAAILKAAEDVYRSIATRTGCRVIVDSSKNPSNALLVSFIPNIELHVLHVVRNPQNVVASWAKKKGYLATHPARRVIAWWWSYNILSEALKLRARTYRRTRYEDFARAPEALLQDVASDTVGASLPTPFMNGSEATVHVQHVLAGNPDKFDAGKVKIKDDIKASLGNSQKLLVNLLTFPLQMRYQYLP
jgi:Sulfotransferase family